MPKLIAVGFIFVFVLLFVESVHHNQDDQKILPHAKIRIPHTRAWYPQCRFVCDGIENSNQFLQELPEDLNVSEQNPSQLIGILLNKSNGFGGFVSTNSSLNQIIRGFPNSTGIIWSTLDRFRNNKSFQILLQILGVPIDLDSDTNKLPEGLNVADAKSELQKLLYNLSSVNGIASTPFGTVIFPLSESLRNLYSSIESNPSNAPLQMFALFDRIPYLSGIFIRTEEYLQHLPGQIENSLNSSLIYFGPERFLQTVENLYNSSASLYNEASGAASSLANISPFVADIIKHYNESGLAKLFPGIDTNQANSAIINVWHNLKQILNNKSALANIQQGPYTIRSLQQLIGDINNGPVNLDFSQLFSFAEALDNAVNQFPGGKPSVPILSGTHNSVVPNLNNWFSILSGGNYLKSLLNASPQFLNNLPEISSGLLDNSHFPILHIEKNKKINKNLAVTSHESSIRNDLQGKTKHVSTSNKKIVGENPKSKHKMLTKPKIKTPSNKKHHISGTSVGSARVGAALDNAGIREGRIGNKNGKFNHGQSSSQITGKHGSKDK